IDKNVKGIIYAGYPGVKGGVAVVDVLFGDYNPGGKITLTFPRSVGQIPLNFPTKPNAQTDAGENAKAKGLLYPFGHGLSYTKFQYTNLKIENSIIGNSDGVRLSFEIQNTGTVKGDEVVQLYIRDEVSSVTTYEKNLRGFERVSLAPNESKTINFTVQPDDLALWNLEMKRVVEPGKFLVMVGASSSNVKLKGSFVVK
ncbi:MAG: beta-glucosidase, partial [Chitinophagaceae bacterium]